MKIHGQSYETTIEEICTAMRNLCLKYNEEYWLKVDEERKYPEEFVAELTSGGHEYVKMSDVRANLVTRASAPSVFEIWPDFSPNSKKYNDECTKP